MEDTILVSTAVGGGARKPLESAKSPGPIYMPKFNYTTSSPPRVVFSGAMRNPSSKQADAGPGPGAYTLGGREWDKPKSCTLSGREKFGSAAYSTAMEVPGPGEYVRIETSQTTTRNPPKYSLRGRPVERPPASSVPAPNAHQRAESLDASFIAKYKNSARVKFGKPPRQRSMSKEATSVFASPGPSEYDAEAGYKVLSTVKTVPAYTLVPRRSTTDRASKVAPEFHDPILGIGKQVLSQKKTAPAASFSGRVKFGSPYFM